MDTDQLTTAVNDLTARVNSIDGQNLPDPTQAQLRGVEMEINGLRTTIRQVTLVLEASLKDLAQAVQNMQSQLNQRNGVVG